MKNRIVLYLFFISSVYVRSSCTSSDDTISRAIKYSLAEDALNVIQVVPSNFKHVDEVVGYALRDHRNSYEQMISDARDYRDAYKKVQASFVAAIDHIQQKRMTLSQADVPAQSEVTDKLLEEAQSAYQDFCAKEAQLHHTLKGLHYWHDHLQKTLKGVGHSHTLREIPLENGMTEHNYYNIPAFLENLKSSYPYLKRPLRAEE
jgi:hypothetical protein